MKHLLLYSLLVTTTATATLPCVAQTPASGATAAPRSGGVLLRITEVPFPHVDYSSRFEQEVARRFRHTAPNDQLTAQVAVRIRRDGSLDIGRVVASSGDTAFDGQARVALERASADRALGPLPRAVTDSVVPVVVTFTARAIVNLAQGRAGASVPAGNDGRPYFEFQVAKPVVALAGAPSFPSLLRQAGVSGEVLAQFVVDTLGRVDTTTFKVLRSSHALFTQAVLSSLPTMQFSPAELSNGRKVKQLVQQPFTFSIQAPAPKDTTRKVPPKP